jgi:plasmid stabilization system protein ParE
MRLEFTPNAEVDIDEATLWYFEQEPELAARFVIELERVLDQILENPNAWTVIEPDIRRALLRTFPYAVIYRIEDDVIQVAMITHQHRDPAHWRRRG